MIEYRAADFSKTREALARYDALEDDLPESCRDDGLFAEWLASRRKASDDVAEAFAAENRESAAARGMTAMQEDARPSRWLREAIGGSR